VRSVSCSTSSSLQRTPTDSSPITISTGNLPAQAHSALVSLDKGPSGAQLESVSVVALRPPVCGDLSWMTMTLISAALRWLRMHNRSARMFVRTEDQSARLPTGPPPPSTGVLSAFLRMRRPLTSMFGWRLLCLWGQFVGTYSAVAMQHGQGGADTSGPYAAVSRRRCGPGGACMGMPCACLCSCPDQNTARRAGAKPR